MSNIRNNASQPTPSLPVVPQDQLTWSQRGKELLADGAQKMQMDHLVKELKQGQPKGKLQEVANTSEQLFVAGNTQNAQDLLPNFAIRWGKSGYTKAVDAAASKAGTVGKVGNFFDNFAADHPQALERLKVGGKLLGPVAAGASLIWSTVNLASRWDKLTPGARVANVAATAATGVGAGAAFAALAHVPGMANLAWGGLGAAGAIYQGINTFREFNDPNKTPGQRDLSLVSTVMQGAGAALLWTPVGMPLLIAGGILGMAGDFLGKIPFVNSAFKWVDKQMAPVVKAVAPVVKAVGHGIVKGAEAIGHGIASAAHAVGHFFSSL